MNKLSDTRKKEVLGQIGLFAAAVFWGSSFPVSKAALEYFSPLFITMVRYLLGGIILGLVLNKRIFTITKKDFLGGAALGLVFYFAYVVQIIGLQYTASSKQSFLAALYVIAVPFLYWIVYKKRPDVYNFSAALLTIFGIYLLTATGPGGFNKGDLITVFSSVLYAVHIAAVGYLVKKMDPIVLTFLQTIVAGIIGLAACLIMERLPSEYPFTGVLAVLYLTVFCTIIAYGLQIVCQKYVSEMKTSIILSLEAVFGTLLSVIFLGDLFTVTMFIGCVVIFTGIMVSETKLKFLNNKIKINSGSK